MPRTRKPLDPLSRDFGVRCGRHLRDMLDKRNIGPTELQARLLEEAGLDVSPITVKKWLSGDRLPIARDFEAIGQVLGLRDYRFALPPPG